MSDINKNNKEEDTQKENVGYGLEERTLDSNDVYDEADIASTLEMNFIAQALERHKDKVVAETHPDFDGVHCVDPGCGEPIPEDRLKLKKVRCVECQSRLDLRNKIYGK